MCTEIVSVTGKEGEKLRLRSDFLGAQTAFKVRRLRCSEHNNPVSMWSQ